MKKYIFSCICILCLSLSGCDYLDTEPGDAISSDRFWETSNARIRAILQSLLS